MSRQKLKNIGNIPQDLLVEQPLKQKRRSGRQPLPLSEVVEPAPGSSREAPPTSEDRREVVEVKTEPIDEEILLPKPSSPSPLAAFLPSPEAPPTSEDVSEVVEVKTEPVVEDTEILPRPSLPASPLFINCGGKGNTSPNRANQHFAHPVDPLQPPFCDRDIADEINYGSEVDSDDNGDEELMPILLSRQIHQFSDTPDDREPFPIIPNLVSSLEQSASMFPHDLFHFDWQNFPEIPISTCARRETFTPSNVGPTIPFTNSYDIFRSIWDDQIMEHIARETNTYAHQLVQKLETNSQCPNSRIINWKDTSVDELMVYFSLILGMGLVVKSNHDEYWVPDDDIISTPGFPAYMSLQRFQLLNTCLHFNNNRDMCKNLTPSEAKNFKIAPIVEHLNRKFQSLYTLNQNIVLDKSLLNWKGLVNTKLMPNKAAEIKSYEIWEGSTGYLWRFEVQAQKRSSPPLQAQQTPLDGPTSAIVLKLICGLENKGYTLWMESFFNSPALARRLKSLGFDVVGTLRTNRQFVPEKLSKLAKEDMRLGQITGFTSGDVDVLVWRDQVRLATISTYHGNATVLVKGKIKPIVVQDYKVMMKSVDKKDARLVAYPLERTQSRVWYRKLFRRLLNVSVLNSFIIANKSFSSLSYRDFCSDLMSSLLRRHFNKTGRIKQETEFGAMTHYLIKRPIGAGKSRLRRQCCVCKKLTHYYCAGCNDKSVCMTPCFVTLHS